MKDEFGGEVRVCQRCGEQHYVLKDGTETCCGELLSETKPAVYGRDASRSRP